MLILTHILYAKEQYYRSLRPFSLSLRAEGVAIPGKQNSKIKGQK
jgi:hypothetical protein